MIWIVKKESFPPVVYGTIKEIYNKYGVLLSRADWTLCFYYFCFDINMRFPSNTLVRNDIRKYNFLHYIINIIICFDRNNYIYIAVAKYNRNVLFKKKIKFWFVFLGFYNRK